MGGCLSKSETKDDAGSSKPAESKPAPAPTTEAQAKPAEPAAVDNGDAAAAKTEPETKLAPAKIYIVYYSTYGHVETMARTMAEALNEAGAHAKCWQVCAAQCATRCVVQRKCCNNTSCSAPIDEQLVLLRKQTCIQGMTWVVSEPAVHKLVQRPTQGVWKDWSLPDSHIPLQSSAHPQRWKCSHVRQHLPSSHRRPMWSGLAGSRDAAGSGAGEDVGACKAQRPPNHHR